MSAKRRLVAILAADIVGYSRMMRADEDATNAARRGFVRTADAAVRRHNGRIFKTAGDSVLAELPSLVGAIECAIAMHGSLRQGASAAGGIPLLCRIGIHYGDAITCPDGDLIGDVVNMAARLQAIAEPGGICISASSHKGIRVADIRDRFRDMGEHALKNMSFEQVYGLPHSGTAGQSLPASANVECPSLGAFASNNLVPTPVQGRKKRPAGDGYQPRAPSSDAGRIRQSALALASDALKDPDIASVYVDRGSTTKVLAYLDATGFSVFPILGHAGSGKTWELQRLLASLPDNVAPLFVSARLARSLRLGVDVQANAVLGGAGVSERNGLQGLVDALRPRIRLLVLLDGINEFQGTPGGSLVLRERLWSLLQALREMDVKCVMTCRTYTWDRSLSDEAVVSLMFVSGHSAVRRERVVVDSQTLKQRIESYEEMAPEFGVTLSGFRESERSCFVSRLACECDRRGKALPGWISRSTLVGDPFFAGLMAKQVLAGQVPSDSPEGLLSEYVRSHCIDKGPRRAGAYRLRSAFDLAGFFWAMDGTVRTYVDGSDVRGAVPDADLNALMNAGLVHDEVLGEDGEPVVVFRHDRVLEYCLFRYLKRKFVREQLPIDCRMARIAEMLAGGNSQNDYRVRIACLMLRDFGSRIDGDASVGEAKYATLSLLRELPAGLGGEATSCLVGLLGSELWGFCVAEVLKNGNRGVLNEFLQSLKARDPQALLTQNAVVAARGASPEVALEFIAGAWTRFDPQVAMRACYLIGDMQIADGGELLESMVGWHSSDARVRNAAVWAAGRIKHEHGS